MIVIVIVIVIIHNVCGDYGKIKSRPLKNQSEHANYLSIYYSCLLIASWFD